jgi:hypothetical protein
MSIEDSPNLQLLLETAEAGQLTHQKVVSGDLAHLRNAWHVALHLKLIETSMYEDDPRQLTSAGRCALAQLRERGARPIRVLANKAQRKGGRPRLAETDPKLQVYQRIRRECESGESPAAIRDRLKADKDFMELLKAARLSLRTAFKNARAYFAQREPPVQ